MTVEAEQNLELVLGHSWLSRAVARTSSALGENTLRNVLAIVDQGLVSGTRFLTTILLGRLCGAFELGKYSLGFTICIFAACLQESLITLPLSIYTSRHEGHRQQRFAGSTLAHTVMLGLLGSVLLLVAGTSVSLSGGESGLAAVLLILALALPMMFLIEFARRFCIARLDLPGALVVDASMTALQASGLALLALTGNLSAATAFGTIAVAGAVVGFVWLFKSRGHFVWERTAWITDAIHNWRFGSWVLASQLMLIVRSMSLPWLLALLIDTTAAGVFAACETISLLANPLLIAVCTVLAPQASGAFVEGGVAAARRAVFRVTALLSCCTTLMSLGFILFGQQLLRLLFRQSFADIGSVVTLLAISIVVEGIGMPVTSGLLAIEKSRVTFVAYLCGSVAALLVWIVLIGSWGLVAAALGALMGRIVTTSILTISFLQLTRTSAAVEVRA